MLGHPRRRHALTHGRGLGHVSPSLAPPAPSSPAEEFKGTFGSGGFGGPARGMTIDEVRSAVASGKTQVRPPAPTGAPTPQAGSIELS